MCSTSESSTAITCKLDEGETISRTPKTVDTESRTTTLPASIAHLRLGCLLSGGGRFDAAKRREESDRSPTERGNARDNP